MQQTSSVYNETMTTAKEEVDPRIERTRRVVLDATAELIGECGFGRTSIEAISDRSGVARSTIYRHWPERSDLLIEAFGKHLRPMVASEHGDLRADLVEMFTHLCGFLTDGQTGTLAAAFISEAMRDPELAEMHIKFTKMRKAGLIRLIEAGIERGELPRGADAITMADDLAAPIFYRALILHQSIDDDWIQSHIHRWIEFYRQV